MSISVGNGTKIGFDLRVFQREVGFQNGENAVGAELLIGFGLFDCICCGRRCNTGDNGHAFARCLDRRLHNSFALDAIEIGEFAGRTERRQAVHSGFD